MRTNLNGSQAGAGTGGRQNGQSTPEPRAPSPPGSQIRSHLCPSVSICGYSLLNTAGFWELTFAGRSTIVPQSQALFYISCLLANPYRTPIRGTDFALQTFHTFGAHLDYRNKIGWLRRHADDSHIRDILVKKQRALEAIIDDEEECISDRAAASAQLKFLLDLQKSHAADIADPQDTAAADIFAEIGRLYNRLAIATDLRGNPNHVLRAFARHILLYILIPTATAFFRTGAILFSYDPPLGMTWSPSAS